MDDPISRQAALDAFWKLDIELRPSAIDAITDMLKTLPSAQPVDKDIDVPSTDCISRQAVIEINRSYHGQMPNEVNHSIWKEINDLPAALRITFDGVTLYRCDPEKNVSCKKTDCYVNGGPCFMTSKKEHSEMDAIRRGDGLRPIHGYESDGSGFRKWP